MSKITIDGGSNETPRLSRALGFWTLTAFGVGDILGAGIYALVGEVAGQAGGRAWLAFLVTVTIAMLTALSYAQLGATFPRSGGEAFFCQQATGWAFASLLIGFLVLASGLVSLATVSLAFSGYVCAVVTAPVVWGRWCFAPGFLLLMSTIAFWGIRQSSRVNVVCTLVEVAGLLFVIGAGLVFLHGHGVTVAHPADAEAIDWMGVLSGSGLAFFAFIGFEDMVNVAEEVKRPERNLPASIVTALGLSAVIYVAVAWVATRVVPVERLSESPAPLLEVVRTAAPRFPAELFTGVAVFAVANTGLLNLVMGSRLLYGMTTQGLLPAGLGAVHSRTQTPHRSILVMLLAALILAISGTLAHLAGTTNFLILLVFTAVNGSLFVILGRDQTRRARVYVARGLALLGAFSCVGLIAFLPRESLRTGAILVAFGTAIIALHRLRSSSRSGSA